VGYSLSLLRSYLPPLSKADSHLARRRTRKSNCKLAIKPRLAIFPLPLTPKASPRTAEEKRFMATANDLRRGMAISYNGDIAVVLDSQHRTPGNLRAFVQASIRSLKSGKSSDVRFSSTEKIEVIPMQVRKMEFSYKDGDDYVFSDPENFETVTVSPEIVGDARNYLVENALVTMTFVEDKAVLIEMPSSVALTVTDAPEGIRGDSANNVQKAVTMETGITVQAPLFIKTGEKIKIDTRTGKYMERA
jgi:elongation factor P